MQPKGPFACSLGAFFCNLSYLIDTVSDPTSNPASGFLAMAGLVFCLALVVYHGRDIFPALRP